MFQEGMDSSERKVTNQVKRVDLMLHYKSIKWSNEIHRNYIHEVVFLETFRSHTLSLHLQQHNWNENLFSPILMEIIISAWELFTTLGRSNVAWTETIKIPRLGYSGLVYCNILMQYLSEPTMKAKSIHLRSLFPFFFSFCVLSK